MVSLFLPLLNISLVTSTNCITGSLGEIQLPLYLKADEVNIGGHKKGKGIGELLERKSIVVPNMTVLRR
jgi:hypothetical protein